MSPGYWVLLSVGGALAAYAAFVLTLVIVGRKGFARAVARFVPDCIVLFRRLLADPRVPRREKMVLAALIPYLVLPFDLVPDFIPIAGRRQRRPALAEGRVERPARCLRPTRPDHDHGRH